VSIADQIVYEDNHLVAVHKRSGQLVQPDDDFTESSLEDEVKDYIAKKYKKPGAVFLGVIHRLDRPVSGIVIFARTSKALERMNKIFKEREIEKTYVALVHGTPVDYEAKLVNWLIKDTSKNVSRAYNNDKRGGVKAELSYTVQRRLQEFSQLRIQPKTGRPHQIRVQLAKIGCPIVGDLKYGSKQPNPDKSICLHALSLEFIHPVKKEKICLKADLPADHLINMLMN